ncbi:MAG TPA: CDP-alcohol phosphatidyltransferase [Gammaproteobacteria bacterium]|jgi:CDP-diacylglycerol--glycerol-3-phosphate 3-phosphatidyltransferase|nr:CDP-alcohol phosphatidyltransferase [Gammaproteobacteria bacterium]
MNLPNAISLTRFLLMPVLVWLAWHSYERAFLMLLALCFFSDVLDGWIARRFHMQTELGARLDSWSDFFNYSTMVIGGWWLWPAIMTQEKPYVLVVVACLIVPAGLGILKFRSLTSYHTWSVKFAALAVAGSGMLLFAGAPAWLFHLAVPFSVVAAVEEICITLVSTTPRSNTPTLWHALRARE